MKSKILIPVMAFVFAIAMSFTTEKSTADVWAADGINDPIPVVVSGCEEETVQCRGKFEGDETEYYLFHDEGLNNPIMGSGGFATITQ